MILWWDALHAYWYHDEMLCMLMERILYDYATVAMILRPAISDRGCDRVTSSFDKCINFSTCKGLVDVDPSDISTISYPSLHSSKFPTSNSKASLKKIPHIIFSYKVFLHITRLKIRGVFYIRRLIIWRWQHKLFIKYPLSITLYKIILHQIFFNNFWSKQRIICHS